MSQQGLRQASFRDIGGTASTYEDDARAAFEAEATIPAGATFNEAMMLWLQERLGSSAANINDLLAEWAAAEGAANASSIGSFDPSGPIALLLEGDEQSNGDRLLLEGDEQSGTDVLLI